MSRDQCSERDSNSAISVNARTGRTSRLRSQEDLQNTYRCYKLFLVVTFLLILNSLNVIIPFKAILFVLIRLNANF
jgi:hypothetical protein